MTRGEPTIFAWLYERPDGGRSAGLTGGHYHANLGNENFRKIVLNTIVWLAKAEVPKNGVEVTPGDTDLRTFRTEVKDGQVYVDLSAPAATGSGD